MALGTLIRTRHTPADRAPGAAPVSGTTDGELLARFARSGDQEAFAALVRRHAAAVLGVCRRILRDDHAAEDAFQAVFLVLAVKPGAVARPEALGGWLYGTALRVALKTRARRDPAATGTPVEPAVLSDPAAGLAADELRVVLDEELARLPDAERDLLVLVYLQGKTHDEAARALGCPLGSVAWRLDRGRESLRRRLARRGVALSVGLLLLLAAVGRAEAAGEALVQRTVAAVPSPPPAPVTPRAAGRTTRVRRLAVALGLVLFAAAFGWAARPRPEPRPEVPAAAGIEPFPGTIDLSDFGCKAKGKTPEGAPAH